MAQELKAYSVVASSETQNYLDGETHLAFEAYDAEEVDAVLAEKDKVIAEQERDIVKLKSSLKYLVVRGLIDGPVKKAVEDLLKEVEDAH